MKNICPLLKKECIEHSCKFYVHLLGANPQTGVQEDRWDCTFAFLPVLLIENSQQTRQAGAALEGVRNEMARANDIAAMLPLSVHDQSVLPPAVPLRLKD